MPSNLWLGNLSEMLIPAVGWAGYHLSQYTQGNVDYTSKSNIDENERLGFDFNHRQIDEMSVTVEDVLPLVSSRRPKCAVWLFISLIGAPFHRFSTIDMASSPLTLTTAMPPIPWGVLIATIVSLLIVVIRLFFVSAGPHFNVGIRLHLSF